MPPLFHSRQSRFLFLCLSFAFQLQLVSPQTDSAPCTEPWIRSYIVDGCGQMSADEKEQLMSHETTILLPSLYLLSFVVGLPSNLVALWVLLFRTKKKPSTILLINLTTCDLMLLVVLPFRIVYHFQGNDWTLGEPFCRLVIALFYGNMYGSILCLALIAFDRYLALVHPVTGLTLRSHRLSMYMSVAVWAVVLAAMSPMLATQQTHHIKDLSITTCHDVLTLDTQLSFFLPYFASLFSICFVLPLLVVMVCNSCIIHTLIRAGKRYNHAVSITVLMMVVGLVCLLPSNILLISHNLDLLKQKEIQDKPKVFDEVFGYMDPSDSENSEKSDSLYKHYMMTLALSTFNSCLDPFIFYYVSEDFREKARQVLCCKEPPKLVNSTQQDTSTSAMSYRSKETTSGDLLSSSGRASETARLNV